MRGNEAVANAASADMDNYERMWRDIIAGVSKAATATIRNEKDSAFWDDWKADLDRGRAEGLTPVMDLDATPDQLWPYPTDVLGFLWSIDPVVGRAPETLTQEQGRLLVAVWVGDPADSAMPDALYDALDAAGLLRDGDRVPVEPNLETVSGPNGELGDVLHDINVLCATCEHYRGNSRCEAFRGDIPWAIVAGLHDHRRPYPGDGGILYTLTTAAPARLNL